MYFNAHNKSMGSIHQHEKQDYFWGILLSILYEFPNIFSLIADNLKNTIEYERQIPSNSFSLSDISFCI